MPVKYRLCGTNKHTPNLLHTQGHERQPFPLGQPGLRCGTCEIAGYVSQGLTSLLGGWGGPCSGFLSFVHSADVPPGAIFRPPGSQTGVLKSSRATCYWPADFHCTPKEPFELWQVGPGKWINRKPSGGSGFESLFSSLEKGSCPLGCESEPLPAALTWQMLGSSEPWLLGLLCVSFFLSFFFVFKMFY